MCDLVNYEASIFSNFDLARRKNFNKIVRVTR